MSHEKGINKWTNCQVESVSVALPPIVGSWNSKNSSLTNRTTRQDLPTAASPRRTNLKWQTLLLMLCGSCVWCCSIGSLLCLVGNICCSESISERSINKSKFGFNQTLTSWNVESRKCIDPHYMYLLSLILHSSTPLMYIYTPTPSVP